MLQQIFFQSKILRAFITIKNEFEKSILIFIFMSKKVVNKFTLLVEVIKATYFTFVFTLAINKGLAPCSIATASWICSRFHSPAWFFHLKLPRHVQALMLLHLQRETWWFLSSVYKLVSPGNSFLTLVRFLSCVYEVVLFEVTLSYMSCLYEFMVFEGVFCSEALATFLTLLRLLSCVDELVFFEMTFQCEVLATFFTLVGFLSCV